MQEIFTSSNALVEEDEWKRRMEDIRQVCTENLSREQGIRLLAASIENAVKIRIPEEKFGILFSGGVDSTLISFLCRKFNADFTCYSVGLKNSEDLKWAGRIARHYGFAWKHREYSIEEVGGLAKNAVQILGFDEKENIAVSAGVASVELAAIELAKTDGVKILLGGLGSEEIFAGYERHAKAGNYEKINEECWNGLFGMWKRDLIRDAKIATHTAVEFRTPFLDAELMKIAMKIPGELKIGMCGTQKTMHKKLILRETAEKLGLEAEFAFRPKKAAQYGSGFDKAIEKLSKRNGFNSKGEWLRFIRAVVRPVV